MPKVKNILFVTWDGPQVNYLEGLFIPIFKGLEAHGYKFHILQFSWGSPERLAITAEICAAADIPYRQINVWLGMGGLGPLATAIMGARHIRQQVKSWNIDTLMPRSLMPALATLMLRDRSNLNVIFDADGLAADERVDFAGLSPRSWTYRILRDIEAQMVRVADAVLVRSKAAIDILVARAGSGTDTTKFTVVTNGRDPAPYQDGHLESQRQTIQPFTICYIGSLGEKYGTANLLEVARALKRQIPDLKFHVYTGSPEVLFKLLGNESSPDHAWIHVDSIPNNEVPSALKRCDLGLAFPKMAFSMRAVTLTKLGEYLLAGLPVVGTPGIGDIDDLSSEGIFLASDGTNHAEILQWVQNKIIPHREELRQKCHRLGVEKYSLNRAVSNYRDSLLKLESNGFLRASDDLIPMAI